MTADDLPTLEDLLHRPAWHADALCREFPDVNFFPERGETIKPAREVCSRCLVADECRAAGIDGLELGIWGGISARERRKLRTLTPS